jgi:hypothetical protein
MLRRASRSGDATLDAPSSENASGQIMLKPRTLTEVLNDQIAFHKAKIADLEEAKAAISPEVERALNAIAKL